MAAAAEPITDASLSLERLVRWGEDLGARLVPGNVVALYGDLGAGKTTLAQAICRGYGVTQPVTSPTYAIVHEYAAPRSVVWHLDLYRLGTPADLVTVGFDELVAGDAVAIIEWPERAGQRLPPESIGVHLAHDPRDPARRYLRRG